MSSDYSSVSLYHDFKGPTLNLTVVKFFLASPKQIKPDKSRYESSTVFIILIKLNKPSFP